MQIIAVTLAAIARLKAIQVDHPEDPIIRIMVRDLDQTRLNFSITLESTAQPDDAIQAIDGLTIALERQSVSRMDGVTLDYTTTDGFRFLHSEQGRSLPLLTIPTLN
jgi:Fe-S cluster assembly iron-binding protein IscA